MKQNFKPTRIAPLPFKGAPLGIYDLVMQQVQKEQYLFAEPDVVYPEEVMKKELPSTKWTPVAKYVYGLNLIKSVLPL